ncbi:trypsin-like serine protease [Saccharothrix obliqua]|uniref:trypsin-like serine protease n=1 Tax=Saccharothrix obliqua TaxID=2861747 RepID=UPI001C5FD74E|nr:trypsin-like serine protease [Saccharothrix obliqua]MBW4721362.1 trypsin-like serine protease [Saccharothrix obliqua]
MHDRSSLARRLTAVAAAVVAAGFLVGPGASALGRSAPTPDGAYPFVARVDVDGRLCSGVLVAPQWVATAGSCFAGSPPAGAPTKPTTVTLGRTVPSSTAGHRFPVVELVPRGDRNLVLAKLAYPAAEVAPISIATTPPASGEIVRVAGFGRTTEAWVPDRMHTTTFAVESVGATSLAIVGNPDPEATTCRGDAGGPAFREVGGVVELVALHDKSWQHSCFGESETRKGTTETRLDDIAGWIAQQTPSEAVSTYAHTFQFRNAYTDRCLTAPSTNNVDRAAVYQFTCGGQFLDRVWRIEQVGSVVQIRNPYTDRCLTAPSSNNVDRAVVYQFTCGAQFLDRVWRIEQVGPVVQIRNVYTNRCLTAPSTNNVDRAELYQFTCGGEFLDRVWHVEPTKWGA